MGEIKFRALQHGSTISIIAPARAVSPEEIAPFENWAHNRGWNVKKEQHLFGRKNQFSGSDEERTADFIAAWTDPNVDAVIAARGGYGSMRWIPMIPEEVWKQGAGKALIGYSDICSLHYALNRRGFETIHGPMAFNLYKTHEETEHNFSRLEMMLKGESPQWDLSTCEKINTNVFEGEITGGNLSILFASLGVKDKPDFSGKILLLEDLDEYLYHMDRMMVTLRNSGVLKEIKALIVGDMPDMKDNAIPFGSDVKQIIAEHTAAYNYPVIFDFPAGHGVKNTCFKMNAYTKFDGTFLTQPN